MHLQTGDDAINAQARLAARLIIDGCDGLGTDVEETKEGIRLIRTPVSTGDAEKDKANAKKVYDKVNDIIKNHKSFGASFKDLKDYLSGDLWASEIKYLDGILAENNAIQGEEKTQAVKDLVQEAVEGAGTDIEYLKQAIKAISSPEEMEAIEEKLKEYCEKKGIKPQIAGQSYLQAILYDECDTFLGVSTDHKEIRKFNEMLIAQGAYTPEQIVKLRAEQAALQVLEGNFASIQDAVRQIKDADVLARMNNLLATKDNGFNDIETFMQQKGFSQTKIDLINAELAGSKLLDEAKSADIAFRLLQDPDFDNRAMGFKAITTGEIAHAVSEMLASKGLSLEKITEQFNKEKASNKEKAAFWDGIAGFMGGFSPLGYIAEHISDKYNENTETSDSLYVESKEPIELSEEQKAAYQMTVKTFEEQLNKMKEDYQEALDSQGVVSGALNAFCSVYNIGTTRDDIEARIKHDEETLRLMKIASEGKLARVENGKTTPVTFEEVFEERASEFITANGASISAIKNNVKPKEVTEFSVEKVEKVAKKAQTIVAMDYAKDNIAICWNELNKGLNSKDNKELSVAICDTMEKLSQMSGQTMTLDAFGYKVSNGVIVDASGNPVSADKLSEISAQLKKGLSEISEYLLGTSIPADATDADLKDILNDAYEDKMEAFKQEYREAFGQQATDEMIENYMKTINYSKMAVNFGLLIGATIAAPFTGGGSLAVFAATAGVSFGMNALEKSTDADGYTNSEWTSDAEQALWDGALTALGFKVGQMAEMAAKGGQGFLQAAKQSNKWIAQITKNLPADKAAKVEKALAKLSQLSNIKAANISSNIISKNKALIAKFAPNMQPATAEKVTACISRIEACGFEVSSDTIQSLIQTYCQEGEFNSEAFMQGLIMSVIGNAAGHAFSIKGDVQELSHQKAVDMLGEIKGADGKVLFSADEISELLKNNPKFAGLKAGDIDSLKQKLEIFGQMKTADGNVIFTPAQLNDIVKNYPDFMDYTMAQVKALNDKVSELTSLKDVYGNLIFTSQQIRDMVKGGGIYLADIPTSTLCALASKDVMSSLPVLLSKIKSADDAALIDIFIGAQRDKMDFSLAALEDILEIKHNSQLSNFNGFAARVLSLDHSRGSISLNNYASYVNAVLYNIKTDTQRQAFKKLCYVFEHSDTNYSNGSFIAKIFTTDYDLKMLNEMLQSVSTDEGNICALRNILNSIRNFTGNDLEIAKEILYRHLQAKPEFIKLYAEGEIPSSILLPASNLSYSDLDMNLLFKTIDGGDSERVLFLMQTSKQELAADTLIMRYIKKSGNVPYDAVELKNIKTNSQLQDNAFDLLLDRNGNSRFEALTIQEIIDNVKTKKDLDNLEKLLDMKVDGKPLTGHIIIENLKNGNIDTGMISQAMASKGIPYNDADMKQLANRYGIHKYRAKLLLELRQNSLKRYNKIINSGLLDLIKEGKVDESILKNIDGNSFLSNRTLKDIRRLANGESLITTLKNQSDLSEISKHVEYGEVCEFNGKLYVNDDGQAVEIKLTRQKFEELFPPLTRVSFEQNNLGDCWLVSTIDNLMDMPGGRVALYKLFEQQGDDVLIKFPGVNQSVKFPGGKSLKTPSGKQVASPGQMTEGLDAEGTVEGILIIEQAYAVHRLRNGARAYDANSPVTDIRTFTDVDGLMERLRSGGQKEALNEIFGKNISTRKYGREITSRQTMQEMIKQYANSDRVIVTFGTKRYGVNELPLAAKYDIYSNHAYSIKGYDEATGMVYITNPWHTSVVTEVPMSELLKHINVCTIADLSGKPINTVNVTPAKVSVAASRPAVESAVPSQNYNLRMQNNRASAGDGAVEQSSASYNRASAGYGAVEQSSASYNSASAGRTADNTTNSSRGIFSRFNRFLKSVAGKSDADLLNTTKISDKISALGNITDMYGNPKFSAAELDRFKKLLNQYKQMGHNINEVPLNTMFAVASLPTVRSTDDIIGILLNANSPDKLDILNRLVNTNSVFVQSGIVSIPKSSGVSDIEFLHFLLSFTKYDPSHTGKVKLLDEIMNPNGPIRPAISKFDENTAYQIADILNRAETAEDVNRILGNIERFKNTNSPDAALSLDELESIIDIGTPLIKTGSVNSPMDRTEVQNRIMQIMNRTKASTYGHRSLFDTDLKTLLDNFDYENAERHLKNIEKVLTNIPYIGQLINKGWFSSLEGAQAFEEVSRIFSFESSGNNRSPMDMVLSYMTVQEWQNAKRAGLVNYAGITRIDPFDFVHISKMPENKIRALINSGLAPMGIRYISDNNDINHLFRNIAGRSKQRTYNIRPNLENLENLIKQSAGNDPAKIKELSQKLQTLDDKFLNEIIHYNSVPKDLEFYINNVENIYKKVQRNIKDFDDSAFTGDFTSLSHIVTRENVQVFDELVTLDGIDQTKLYSAISYADTPAKVHHLQVIIDKIKSGEESIIALPFVKHSEVNPRIAQAKYLQMPKFETGTNPASLVTSTKQGQVVAIGNKTYIHDRGKMVELDISADTYEKLFPPYETLCIRQGNETGDCYFLSGGLIAFMKNDYARINLLKLIKQEGNDIVITFPAFPNQPVRFSNGNIKLQNLHAETSLGNLMLEQAYAKARYANAHNISNASTVDTDKAMDFIYGGHESDIFNELLGTNGAVDYVMQTYSNAEGQSAQTVFIDKNQMSAMLDKYAGRDDVLLCGGSESRDGGYLPDYGITPKHAYCIEKIDSQNKTVTIINPYNSLYCMTITYEQFTDYFATLAVKELNV